LRKDDNMAGMTRRSFVKTLGLGLPMAGAAGGGAIRASSADRPNVLWIYIEDTSPWMRYCGDGLAATPRVDELAAQGAAFSNCRMPAAVCSPVRSAIITGCMQTTLGIHNHRSSRMKDPPIVLPPRVKTVPEIFRAAGYFTFNSGKDDYNFAYDRNALYAGDYTEHEFYGKTGKKIDWTARAPGAPFFGQIQLSGGKHNGKIGNPTDPAKVGVPPYYPDHPIYRREIARHYDQIRLTDAEIGGILDRLKADGLYENTIVFVFSDHGCRLPRHKQFLYDGGLHVPLLIAWPGNPGAVRPGTRRDDLVSGLDISATTLALAGFPVPDWMESRDMLRRDYKREFIIAARDRCDYTIDRIRAVRTPNFKYLRNFMTDRPYLQPQYRDGDDYLELLRRLNAEGKLNPAQAAFASAKRPAEELYNLENDPHEIRNLAGDPIYDLVLDKMRARLERWMVETDDKGRYPESPETLRSVLGRWKEKCVNPEYDAVRG